MKTFPLNETIRQFSSVFSKNGFSLYVVGGAVRDFLLGLENHDYDFCTNALPQQIIGLFRNVIQTGIKHGTVTVLFKGQSFEVTTFRTESSYSDRRHPDSVSFVSSLEEDLSRRDFTVNAFAADCDNGRIIDLFNGTDDLKEKIIRAIGNPDERFNEDALRMLRMCRFAAKLGFEVDKATFDSACNLYKTIGFVSEERIADELSKLLMSDNPKTGLQLFYRSGLMKETFPALYDCKNVIQKKFNSDNALDHIIESVQAAADRNCSLTVRWALLLHDIGKADPDNCRKHDEKSAEMALKILKQYKFSNKMQEDIGILIRNHMVRYTPSWTDGDVKRFINRIGKERIDSLFQLQWCDQIASEGVSKEKEYSQFISRIEKCSQEPLTIKDLEIRGEDLNSIGIPKGIEMGKTIQILMERVLDDPLLNTKEKLLELAASIFDSKGI